MAFIMGLPRTQIENDAIWVIVDRITKSAHFLAFKTTTSMDKMMQLYMQRIVALHGTPISIMFDRDS